MQDNNNALQIANRDGKLVGIDPTTGETVPVTFEEASIAGQPIRDVTAYGAVGDGSTDDTTAIQSALDEGGIIWVPHGRTFRADGLVAAADEIHITGGGTIKRRDGDGDDRVLTISGSHSSISNVTIDGASETTSHTNRGGNLLVTGDFCRIHNIVSENTIDTAEANAIYVRGKWCTVSSSLCRDIHGVGVRLSNSGWIYDTHVRNWGLRGIVCDSLAEDETYHWVTMCSVIGDGDSDKLGDSVLFDTSGEEDVVDQWFSYLGDSYVVGSPRSNTIKFDLAIHTAVMENCYVEGEPGYDLLRANSLGTISVKGCRFEGGATVSPRGNRAVFNECDFYNRQGSPDALRARGGRTRMRDCSFVGQGENDSGKMGAVSFDPDSGAEKLLLEGCTFDMETDSISPLGLRGTEMRGGFVVNDLNIVTGDGTWRSATTSGILYGSSDEMLVIDGTATEATDAEEPQKEWAKGVIVNFEDIGDDSGTGLYLKLYDGSWAQIN